MKADDIDYRGLVKAFYQVNKRGGWKCGHSSTQKPILSQEKALYMN